MTEASIRAAFDQQRLWSQKLGTPFMERVFTVLGRDLDRSTVVGARVLDWPGEPIADALVLRLAGGLHALVRAGKLPALAALYPPNPMPGEAELGAELAAALAHPELAAWLESAPQTNEVGRSAVLMAGLRVVAAETGLPLAVFELGASAGLNLRLDAYAYDLGGDEFGLAGAPLRLVPKWEGAPPPEAEVSIVERRGVDLNPLDVTSLADQARMLAYVWPDQPERLKSMATAIAAAAADPPPLDRGDAAAWVEARIAPVEGRATVVMHSIAFQYFPPDTQARITAHMAAQGALATASAPLAWLRYELDVSAGSGSPPTLRLLSWPGGEDRHLAYAHPHGASVRWLL
ncbi:DUF2332 family protein [Sphingosinicellaceae bacterium]|nr:DUF2332 family protein [Sphingosinicellaceae bacterium]